MSIIFTKFTDEIAFVLLFVSVITVNKYVLSVLWFTQPTVFQGWQTLVCILLLTLLIKLEKIKNELQSIEKQTLYIIIPALFSFTVSIVAGSIALAALPVPIFLAATNLIPATQVFLDKKNDSVSSSLKVCGSMVIFGTILTLLVFTLDRWPISAFLWLLLHVSLVLLPVLYYRKLRLDHITPITKIYYQNFFSVLLLLPVSVYLDALHLPHYVDLRFYVGCVISGICGTFLQLFTSRVESSPTFLHFRGLAKLLSCVVAWWSFHGNVEPMEWGLVLLNLSVGTFVLNLEEECESPLARRVYII